MAITGRTTASVAGLVPSYRPDQGESTTVNEYREHYEHSAEMSGSLNTNGSAPPIVARNNLKALLPLTDSATEPPDIPSRKRRHYQQGDAYSRMICSVTSPLATTKSTKVYVRCPLCGELSQKTFALGRGIATHLLSIHTPWKPTKSSRKLARRIWERENRNKGDSASGNQPEDPTEYEPSPGEVERWETAVAKLLQQLEEQSQVMDTTQQQGALRADSSLQKDRSSQVVCAYKDSLPPFLESAALGQLDVLRQMLAEAGEDRSMMLNQRDRHGSFAEHWAAGGGHLECLRLLMESKSLLSSSMSAAADEHGRLRHERKRARRRDGKTCLHYAARNGQLNCIRYLVETQQMDLDVASGEGTTPLHMACYGGHLPAIIYFVERAAKESLPNPALATNAWKCRASHWIAMTLNKNETEVWKMCTYLQGCGVDFGARQDQGHSPLHKAAHRLNRHVLEWMVGSQCTLTVEELVVAAAPDEGGHTPSDIWRSVGGDLEGLKWMKSKGW